MVEELTDRTQRSLRSPAEQLTLTGGRLSRAQEGWVGEAWQTRDEPGFLSWWPGRERE